MFGSSSLSTSTYHHHHHPIRHREEDYRAGHVVPREPIKYYKAGGVSPTPATLAQPTPRPRTHPGQPPRPPGPLHDPQQPPHLHMQPPPTPEQPYHPPEQHQDCCPPHAAPPPPLPPPPPPVVPHTQQSELRDIIHVNRAHSLPRRPSPPRRPSTQPRSPPRQPSPSPPPPARRGQVVNAPRPAFSVLAAGEDATASLTPLATISKSGVPRTEMGHRAGGVSRGRDSPTRPHRRPTGRVTRPAGGRYTFLSGEVYTPPPLQPRPSHPHPQKPFFRITTRRPLGQELAVIPYKESYSTFEPKYVKDTIAEMEFEPKTMPAPPPPAAPAAVHWFLMPVQGWFVLSIILAALVVVLGVGSALLYSSLRKQKRKMKRLTGGSAVMLSACSDPVKHEACGCRALAPLVRSHTLLSRASIMTSRASQRSLRSLSLPRHPATVPSPPQSRAGGGMRSLPTSTQHEKERDTTFDSITTTNTQLEVEDTPPPLAPKKSSLSGMQDVKGGGRESRLGIEGRGGSRDSRIGAYDGRHGVGGLQGEGYGRGSCQQRHTMPSDVQLTTIYPPPRRFEL
ncbi:hypothetical protein O3P69_000468 [Scylla paramamosain]|uniref:Uncharacterized protein n=1 Tax=Scylla paramamosain TaxID=85552 RepID=A0AAW0UU18_SCYPA